MTPTLTYRRRTNVAHIEVHPTGPRDPVEVLEVGEELGFPGLVLVRFNPETGEIYGCTIQRWSYVKRQLMWRYRTIKVKAALERMISKIYDTWNPEEHGRLALMH
jgi:hypothetical protein